MQSIAIVITFDINTLSATDAHIDRFKCTLYQHLSLSITNSEKFSVSKQIQYILTSYMQRHYCLWNIA